MAYFLGQVGALALMIGIPALVIYLVRRHRGAK
jgi:hypothetical protein